MSIKFPPIPVGAKITFAISFLLASLIFFLVIYTDIQGREYDEYCFLNVLYKNKKDFIPYWQCGNEKWYIVGEAIKGIFIGALEIFAVFYSIILLLGSLFKRKKTRLYARGERVR